MRVRLHTLVAGPAGCWAPGENDLPDDLASQLVGVGAAVPVEATKPASAAAVPPVVETAAAPRRGETSDAHRRKGRVS